MWGAATRVGGRLARIFRLNFRKSMHMSDEEASRIVGGAIDACDSGEGNSEGALGMLSKNAQKRLIKAKRHEETRVQWRAMLKEKQRAKKEKKAKERATARETQERVASDGTEAALQPSTVDDIDGKGRNSRSAPIIEEKRGCLLVDLAFEDLMHNGEICSLVAQLCRSYSVNRRCPKPYNLVVTGLSGKTNERLQRVFPENNRWDVSFSTEPLEECKPAGEIVYLSADAEEILTEVGDDTTYVIGGLVDRNRHKNVAANRALGLGIRTAKLPLAEHISLKSSRVLTIVHGMPPLPGPPPLSMHSLQYGLCTLQDFFGPPLTRLRLSVVVFEIMCKRRELGSWREAIMSAIPERKRAVACTSEASEEESCLAVEGEEADGDSAN